MENLRDLISFSDKFPVSGQAMPALFVGHGSPMNAIEETEFSARWKALGRELPRPKAIVCISAHWETRGTFVTSMENPKTIHDFGGFPEELFAVEYPAPGNPLLAQQTKDIVKKAMVELDIKWGLDHGAWSVLKRMYPEADVPVVQLSLDRFQSPERHYDLAKDLAPLRNRGVLILGSGNMVHNLGRLDWQHPETGYDWAQEANDLFKRHIVGNEHRALADYASLGEAARLSVPTPEHYLPMLYILGLRQKNDNAKFFNDKTVMGSLSMTSFTLSSF